jgi:RNA polymerase sigma-70 factor, ECF subfamily
MNTVHGIHTDPKRMSDVILVSAARAGDTTAFVQLNERYSKRLLRTTYQITRNWQDAEDAVQETFLKTFLHLNNFEGRCSFSTWLTRIAVNSALMTLRKRRASREIDMDSGNEDSETWQRWEPQDTTEDPERRYARCEAEILLRAAIARLQPAIRDALELRHAHGYSMKEIAETLDISPTSAKSRLHRARRELRTSLL